MTRSSVGMLAACLLMGCEAREPEAVPNEGVDYASLAQEVELYSPTDTNRVTVRFQMGLEKSGAVIAERISPAYLVWIEWDSGQLVDVPCETFFNVREVGVVDLYGAGDQAVLLVTTYSGSGWHSAELRLIVPSAGKVVTLTLTESHQATEPMTNVKTSANYSDPEFVAERTFLEEFKHRYGYVDEQMVREHAGDIDYAAYFWAKANKGVTDGPITIRRLPGHHPQRASVNDQIADGDIVYTAFFKGAVWGYDKDADESFVVFHPDFYYCWPTELRKVGNWLLINTRGEGLVFVNTKSWLLKRADVNIETIASFSISGNQATVNEAFSIDLPPESQGSN